MQFQGNLVYTAMVPIIKEMIARQMSPELQSIKRTMGANKYLEEFCTFQIHAARQMGHSLAILKLLGDVMAPSVLISDNKKLKDLPPSVTHFKDKDLEASFYEIRGQHVNVIVVDNASYMPTKHLSLIKAEASIWAASETTFLLVLLG
jgi:hypothetical protein